MEKKHNCKSCQYFKEKMSFEVNESLSHEKYGYCFMKHAYIIKMNDNYYLLKSRNIISSKELQKINELHLYKIIIGRYHIYLPIPIDYCYDLKKKITLINEI